MLTIRDGAKINWGKLSLEDCAFGNVSDTRYTLEIYHILNEKLCERKVQTFIEKVIDKLHLVLSKVSYRGIDVSVKNLEALENQAQGIIMDLEDKIYADPVVKDKTKNISSPSDLASILYLGKDEEENPILREDGFNFYWSDETDSGNPSTDKESLEFLLDTIEKELLTRGERLEEES